MYDPSQPFLEQFHEWPQGERIDDNDILIAGIMLTNGIKEIITRNVKHFERIEGLDVIKY